MAIGLDVLKYLNYVFQRISMADGRHTNAFLEALMPWNEAVLAEFNRKLYLTHTFHKLDRPHFSVVRIIMSEV